MVGLNTEMMRKQGTDVREGRDSVVVVGQVSRSEQSGDWYREESLRTSGGQMENSWRQKEKTVNKTETGEICLPSM